MKKQTKACLRVLVVFIFISMIALSSCQENEKTTTKKKTPITTTKKLTGRQTMLFNGQNFEGWYFVAKDSTFTGGIHTLFEVEDGGIHVLGKPKNKSEQPFAGIITENEYSNYDLYLEYKWGEKKFKPRDTMVRDAGILFHMHGEDVIWPNSVECQIQEGDTGDIWAIGTKVSSKVQNIIRNYAPEGDLITRGGEGINFSRFHRGYMWEVPDWNSIKLEIRGDNAKYFVNGHLVNEALDMKFWDKDSNSFQPLTKGKILLQAEGAEIYYRNIIIEEMSE